MDPRDVLARDREDALAMLRRIGVRRMRGVLQRAQRDLDRRLDAAVRGPGAASYTAAEARAALQQVRHAVRLVQGGLRDVLLEGAGEAAERSAADTVRYLESAERAFSGVARPLGLDLATIVDSASSGVRATVLRRLASSGDDVPGADPTPHRARAGILERYGLKTIGHFEEVLQRGLVARAPWRDVRQQITDASPFLQAAPAHWAERIVRTECLTGDSPITGAVVRAIFRRRYNGYVADICTEGGRHFTATPNHPMLERGGWLATNELRVGDDLVRYRRKDDASATGNQDVDDRPPTIRELFDSAPAVEIAKRGCSDPDFHGDGSDGEVDVFCPLGFLRVGKFATINKPIAEKIFSPPDSARARFCPICRRLLPIERRPCFCERSYPQPGFLDAGSDDGGAHANVARDRLESGSALVKFQDLSGVDVLSSGMPVSRVPKDGAIVRAPPNTERADVRFQGSCPHADLARDVRDADPQLVEFDRPCEQLGGSSLECRNTIPRDARASNDVLYPRVAETHDRGDSPGAEPGDVEFDRVVSIVWRWFSGHVYNLETPVGYFTTCDLYTGNTHGIYQRAAWEGVRAADDQAGDVLKILAATFDDRTAADSYAVHGQIRRPDEAFESWFGLYQHPPNRPNDREVVVPHRMAWPIPPYLAWRTDAQVAARWRAEGRRGRPPPRPKMTTVPLDRIGRGGRRG